jgi:ankyrin repeat protein
MNSIIRNVTIIVAVVDFLLKRNCKVDAINKYGQTALHAACKNGNIDIVNSLLKCNSIIKLCGVDVHTPLYKACVYGHTDVVQILLDNNCDIPDDAIHEACRGGYKDIVVPYLQALNNGVGRSLSEWSIL